MAATMNLELMEDVGRCIGNDCLDMGYSGLYGPGINMLIPCALTCGLVGHPFVCPDMVGGGEWTFRFLPGFEMDEELFELYLKYHFTICERSDLVGASHHILDVFRKENPYAAL